MQNIPVAFDVRYAGIAVLVVAMGAVLLLMAPAAPSGRTVADNSKVLIDYTLGVVDENGIRVLQTTSEKVAADANIYSPFNSYEPVNLTVGAADIVKGLSEALVGMREGEEKTFAVPPEKAYGAWDQSHYQLVPLTALQNAQSLRVGSVVQSDAGPGTVLGLVNATHVAIDFNNPLAGRTLVYRVKVVRVVQ